MADTAVATPPAAPDIGALAQQTVTDYQAKQADVSQRREAEEAPIRDAASQAADALAKQAAEPVQTLPLPKNLAQHIPPKELNDAASVWMTLGALGGLLMRRPMTAALGNMTAAMKGVQEGDAEQYDKAMSEFKTNFDAAMKQNKAMLAEKEKALKDTNLSLTARMEQMRLIDVKYGNETGRNTQTFNAQMKLYDAQLKTAQHAADARQRLDTHNSTLQMQRERMAQAERHFQTTQAGGVGGAGIDPKTVDFYARQSLSGDNSWQVGLARGKVGQQLIAAVKDRIPALAAESDMTPQDASAMKVKRDALARATADRQKALSAAQQFIRQFQSQAGLVEKYLEAGTAGDVPAFNKWIQAGRKATGDADVAAFDTAIRGLAREHQRIVTGVTSNAQLHVSSQQTADELLNRSMSPDQIKATMKVMREEAGLAVDAGKAELEFNTEQMKHLGPQQKPKPTDADREWARQSTKNHDNYVKHFGVEP